MELILHQLITGTAKEEEVVEEEMDDEVVLCTMVTFVLAPRPPSANHPNACAT